MANFTIPNLGTAVVGFATTAFSPTETSFTVENTKPTSSNRNIEVEETRRGWLDGRRPNTGQLYPRGVYNK